MKIAIYARVSTAEQDASLQLQELRKHAADKGFYVVGEYVDLGVSGSKESRPQLNRLMVDAQAKLFDAVLVWKLDRFGRSLKHLVNALDAFDKLGVAFISLTDNLDLSTPQGRLMFGIIGSMAQFERSLIQQRVKSGMASAKINGTRSGKAIGRPRLVVDADMVASLRLAGSSWAQIESQTGIPAATARRACQKAA